MSQAVEFKFGDPCPACGGTLEHCPQPTPAMRAAAANLGDANKWVPIPPHYDTAPLDVVEEHGELWKCPRCGYPHRFKLAAADAFKAPRPA